MKRHRMRIGAELRDSAEVEVVESPYDGRAVGEVCVGGPADMDDAIAAACEAFEVTRRLPSHARVAILERTAEAIRGRAEELARLMALESGKPIRFCKGEVERAVVTFALAASEVRAGACGEVLPVDLEPRGEERLCLWTRVPRGPVAALSPFNFPLNLIAHKVAPAIAVGASVILKPPPQCPLTGHVLAEILDEAGLPPGGLNVLHCSPETAQRMVEDPRPAVLSFTGSDAVGWRLKSLAGKKQVLLELGGNAPCLIDQGVAVDDVLEALVTGAWANAGQVCIRAQRVFVHESGYVQLLERFVDATRETACGDPLDERTVVGPLIDARQVARVREWIDEAVAAGARLHCGGEVEGGVMTPAVLTDVDPSLRVCTEEVFGPVTIVSPVASFEEGLEACNATRFGLQAGVFTRDLGHALLAYRELDYGGVIVNDVPTFRVDNFPYGGTKDSGFGREGVRFAMREMTETRVLVARGLG